MQKKKYEKAEDFIGWKSEDGLLEVIGIHGKQGNVTTYRVVCNKCREDKELYQSGYFVSTKGNLKKGKKPCGCSKKPEWTEDQYLILAKRASKGRFTVHGFAEEFKNRYTKLSLECLVDGYKWTPNIHNTINGLKGCPVCAGNLRKSEDEVFNNCNDICIVEGYTFIGFPDGYKNTRSRFEYFCPKHGIQNVSYNDFVNGGRRCRGCWRDSGVMYGYYPERKDEQDFLYVLNFNDRFLKVGRSFDVDGRIVDLRKPTESNIKNIIKIRLFTATHQEIYDLEQELHSELRERNFQHYVDWSTECFQSDCLF